MKSTLDGLGNRSKEELIAEIERLQKENTLITDSITGSVYLTWHFDIKNSKLEIGKGSMKILGFQEHAGFSFEELKERVHPEDKSLIELNYLHYFDTYPNPHEYKLRVLDASDHYRWIASKGRLYKDDEGKPIKIAGALRDITDRVEIETIGKAQESRFQILAEHAREGIIIYDDSKVITDINEAIENMFGYAREDIVGRELVNLIDSKTFQKLEKSKNSGEFLDFTATKADGQTIYLEILVKETRLGVGIIIVHDIHTHKMTELELRKYQQKLELIVRQRTSELDESKKSFEALLDNIDGMAYQYIPEGEGWKTNFISKGVKQLTGHNATELKSGKIKFENDIIHPEYADEIWEKIKSCLSKGESFNVQYPIITKNEEEKWVIDRGKAMFNEDGDIITLEGLILDISKEKERQNELESARKEILKQNALLQQRERSYSALLTNLQGMAYRVLADMVTVTFISDGAYALTGYRADEIKNARQFFEKNIVKRNHQKVVGKIINEALKKKQPYEATYEIICKDGTEKWVSERGVGVFNSEGELESLEGLIIDVTKSKNLEKQLKLARETIDKAPLIIEWVKEDGSFSFVNEEAVKKSGFSKEEFLKKKVYEVDPTLTKEDWVTIFNERHKTKVQDREVIYTKKDGTIFPALINANNLEYEGTVYNISYINDISHLKAIEEELRNAYNDLSSSEEELRQQSEELQTLNENLETQKQELENTVFKLKNTKEQLIHTEKMASLGVLVAGIAHELNNPIGYIKSSSEAMTELLTDLQQEIREKETNLSEVSDISQDFIKMTENINSGALQAAEIIRGLRTFSRMDKQKIEQHNLHNTLDNVLLMLQNNYKYRIKIHRDFSDIPPIECAPGQVNQVFMNLINNAIQAIEGEGNIWIKSECDGDRVIITIKDDGPGIPENIQSRVIEPFFTTKEPGQGTGLGLSISLGIVQDHNGSLSFESNHDGTTFTVSLPINQPKSDN